MFYVLFVVELLQLVVSLWAGNGDGSYWRDTFFLNEVIFSPPQNCYLNKVGFVPFIEIGKGTGSLCLYRKWEISSCYPVKLGSTDERNLSTLKRATEGQWGVGLRKQFCLSTNEINYVCKTQLF